VSVKEEATIESRNFTLELRRSEGVPWDGGILLACRRKGFSGDQSKKTREESAAMGIGGWAVKFKKGKNKR